MTGSPLPSPGELIRAALAERGLTSDDLAASTRLRRGLLEQIAADDFIDTGGDVYARGHLRVIARVLDIDPDSLLAAYDQAADVRRPPAP